MTESTIDTVKAELAATREVVEQATHAVTVGASQRRQIASQWKDLISLSNRVSELLAG